jgi:hypothetical protein
VCAVMTTNSRAIHVVLKIRLRLMSTKKKLNNQTKMGNKFEEHSYEWKNEEECEEELEETGTSLEKEEAKRYSE